MVRTWLIIALFASFAGCASVDDGEPIRFLEYGCDDLVVVGRVKTLGSMLVDDPDRVLGVSVWDMQVRVRRVVFGTEPRKTIPVSEMAHAETRDDVDFLIVLKKPEGATRYSIRWANLASFTRPAERCTELP